VADARLALQIRIGAFILSGLLVFFADHLLHSIQVDAIMETVQRNTLAVIGDGLLAGGEPAPEPEPLDLMRYARGSALQRIGPVVAVVALVVLAVALLRRLRSRD